MSSTSTTNAQSPAASHPASASQAPELTIRAVLTGMAIGALLTPCNVYSGLKIGWAFNMSVAAGLLAFGLWRTLESRFGARPWHLLENNINQTAASSAASIISSGLAAPIPALALLTGQTLAWHVLAVWLFAVSLVGVVVAAGLRNQLLHRERLAFPSGVATAATMQQIHDTSAAAAERLRLLFSGAGLSAALKLFSDFVAVIPKWSPPFSVKLASTGSTATAANLGFSLDPSLLMIGFGAIAGLRVGISMLIGAIVAWGILGPAALQHGWAELGPAEPSASWFAPMVEWLLWPGATLMVVAALTSFAISLAQLWRRRRSRIAQDQREVAKAETTAPPPVISPMVFAMALFAVLAFATATQTSIFAIPFIDAVLAVLLSFVLAVAAARVSGETGITPVGALGKITQLTFGALSPGNMTANLMTANVTGGAAGQCADLMHDLRCGQIIGATPRFQLVAQVFGVMVGSLAGAATYLALVPDPNAMLITPEWPAPAVATWKAVAEVLAGGLAAMPTAAIPAMMIASAVGLALAFAERLLPQGWRGLVPSATALGLAFCIPAWNSVSLFIGALAAAIVTHIAPKWAEHRLVVIAAGLVVGESLAGVVGAISHVFR